MLEKGEGYVGGQSYASLWECPHACRLASVHGRLLVYHRESLILLHLARSIKHRKYKSIPKSLWHRNPSMFCRFLDFFNWLGLKMQVRGNLSVYHRRYLLQLHGAKIVKYNVKEET